MSSFSDRTRTALLVIDVQQDVVFSAFQRDQIVERILKVVNRARAQGIQVMWVQHSDEGLVYGSAGWAIVDELLPESNEVVVHKKFRSAFEATDLENHLTAAGISHLVIVGAESNNCVRSTIHSALDRGYDITLVSDAHTTNSYEWNGHRIEAEMIINELNDSFSHYQLPGRLAMTKSADELFC